MGDTAISPAFHYTATVILYDLSSVELTIPKYEDGYAGGDDSVQHGGWVAPSRNEHGVPRNGDERDSEPCVYSSIYSFLL